jgi:hypothetical protein
MPVTILIVEKTGTIKELNLKTFQESELYKKANLKSADGFIVQSEWGATINDTVYNVSIYGKTTGRSGQENKYEFPPPIDSTLFFGACILVNKTNGQATSITKAEWQTVYEHLYGGFEDIGDDDSDITDEEEDDDVPRTKEGYIKDDFVVDDDEEEDDEEEEEEEEDFETENSSEEDTYEKKSKKIRKSKPIKTKKINIKSVFQAPISLVVAAAPENYLDCTSELSEEEYV